MIKKTVTYTDYNDNERTEELYFNLTQAEVFEMELSVTGGLSETLKKIIAAQNTSQLIQQWKQLLLISYGVKSPDGRRFEKSQALRDEFSQTEAYSQLFMELSVNTPAAIEFVKGIMPPRIPQAVPDITDKPC